ncbi:MULTISPECIES: hypothetical protein [Vibrio]|uniref:FidL-like membrane protein n=1 Tax=bacterium 19MO03SA05 TaxID=2920620 RepID=A0AAU6VGE1_UNCXX|nr:MULTISPECIES: hypothetical protein [Vibrio]EKO3666656.1 hypothetical protein [Vibrio metschnikovii]EKO3707878.1 hypothetical protein [Vibrio metschnikovii]EKO3895317.1 hypothetical protein [Vibrio metschnikovii]EKO3922268.1 hypothetical protein [Vibrio metschnikovii]MDQ2109507.1 hypothetical protein [Vibrio sp. 2017_1457_15]
MKAKITVVLIVIVSMIVSLLVWNSLNEQALMKCRVNAVISIGDVRLYSVISYDMKNMRGVIAMDGYIETPEQPPLRVRRKILVDYTRNAHQFMMKSYHYEVSEYDNAGDKLAQMKLMPDFYTRPDQQFTMIIIPQGGNYVLQTTSIFPTFYCYTY